MELNSREPYKIFSDNEASSSKRNPNNYRKQCGLAKANQRVLSRLESLRQRRSDGTRNFGTDGALIFLDEFENTYPKNIFLKFRIMYITFLV